MAQFFYDFKDGRPGVNLANGPAVGLTRFAILNPANFRQEVMKSVEGIDVWQKNQDGVASTFNFSAGYMWGPEGVMAADVECLAKLVVQQYNGGNYVNDGPGFLARASGQPADTNNYYELQTAGAIASSQSFLRKRVSGVSTDLGGASAGIDKSNPAWFRFRLQGSSLSIKSWANGAQEPSSWGHTATDTSLTAPGYFGFGCSGASGTGYGASAGTRYRLFQLSFGTNGDPAPSSPSLRTVSGIVTGPNGLPVQRVVRIYARATGSLLAEVQSDAGSGAYSFQTAYRGEVNCVFSDDAAGDVFNDLILRTTPV